MSALSDQGPSQGTSATTVVRQALESIVFLTCAVALFRTFVAEGYMISTGSMAPSLLGYHRQVTCSACQYAFPHGASVGDTTSVTASAQAEILGATCSVTCPNCGQATGNVDRYPRNEGDQLLVHKHAYALRSPRRWETVVFRNPSNPVEAYVKRIGGLPGEKIRIHRGDVYADGILQRKSLLTQRSMRVLVYDDHFRPADSTWQPRWHVDSGVLEQDGRYDFSGESVNPDDWTWTTYHHWLRSGGVHQTSVSIPRWPADATTIAPDWPQLRYDADSGRLIARGVVDASWHRRLRSCSDEPAFVAAVDELERNSHTSPIVDHYGYNTDPEGRISYAVRDLFWSGRVRAASGEFRIQMLYGRQPFYATFDLNQGTVAVSTLGLGGREDVLAEGSVPASLSGETGALVEMSLFDRQVLLAVDGEDVVSPVPFVATELSEKRSRTPVRFGVRSLNPGQITSFAQVALHRDVYVTPKGEASGEFEVGSHEYFVLGDNSPVSVDSRVWDNPAVDHAALIGKPFLVHLPSRQQQIHWRGESRHVRLPDWDRVRYVR